MPTHPKLTDGIISRASVADRGDETHWDGELRGLGVRVRNFAGRISRTWIIKYRNATGAQRKLTLGEWPGLGVKAARLLARKEFGRIANREDPAKERRDATEAGTVAELLDTFMKKHVRQKGLSETTAKEYARLIEKVIKPDLGRLAVASIESADVARWHTKLDNTPRQANQALSVLSKAMSFAEKHGDRPQHSNPARGHDRYPEIERDEVPSADDYSAMEAALIRLEAEGKISSTAANVIRMLALTGFRLSEACTLRWRNIDAKAGVITLERTKSKKARSKTRSVGSVTLAIFKGLPSADADHFVFPGSSPHEPVSKWVIERAWQRVRTASGIENLRLHDLRHGVGTVAGGLSANAFMVRDKLGHATLAMTSRYVGKQADPLKELSQRVEDQIAGDMARKVTPSDARKRRSSKKK